MTVIAILRMTLTRVVSSPSGILLGGALVCAWPMLLVLAPIGISSIKVVSGGWSYELAFIGQAAGVILAAGALENLAPVLARLSAGRRLVCEWMDLVACGLFGSGLAVLPGFVCARTSLGESLRISVPDVFPALAATAAGSAMLARLRLPLGATTWLLVCGVLMAPFAFPRPVSVIPQLLLAVAFGLAAWLLDHSPGGAQ